MPRSRAMVLTGLCALVCSPVAALPPAAEEPPPIPSGMDLLYSDRVPFLPWGEPKVAIGLMTGQSQIRFESAGPMQVDFYEGGVHKRVTVKAGEPVSVSVIRAQPAQKRHYIDVESVDWGQADRLDWVLSRWRAQGFNTVEALEQGTVLGLGGQVLDNRQYTVLLPATSHAAAEAKAIELYQQFGQRTHARWQLLERPWGEFEVTGDGAPFGRATSYVRFAPSSGLPITINQVEYGRGYRWHGYEDRAYRGELYAVIDPDGKLAAVNVVGAETILAGVVPSEIFASSPPEALKAQAIAARNHLLAKLGRRHHGDPFHLCGEQHCQVYSGLKKEDPRATAAVQQTYGEALFSDRGLVHAVYSSTCGGHTEDNDVVWGDQPSPALRGRPDFEVSSQPELQKYAKGLTEENMEAWVRAAPRTYCGSAAQMRPTKFRWSRTFSGADIQRIITARFVDLAEVTGLTVLERGPGGKAVSLGIAGRAADGSVRSHTVLHELPIRRLFENLNSGAFVHEQKRSANGALSEVTFRGAGWGHGVGMCQMGAIGRAQAGHGYRRILEHYYNGASIARLYDPR